MSPPGKPELRAELKARLGAASPAERSRWSGAIVDHLRSDPIVRDARVLLVYAPMVGAGEVDIGPLAREALASGRTVAVPRVDWTNRTMTPVRLASFDDDLVPDLVNQRLGLRAPRPDLPPIDPRSIEVVLVPGLGFDLAGRRLGRGAGFYDRFLLALGPGRSAVAVGVGFELQVVPIVPTDPHDQPLDALATETGLRRFNR